MIEQNYWQQSKDKGYPDKINTKKPAWLGEQGGNYPVYGPQYVSLCHNLSFIGSNLGFDGVLASIYAGIKISEIHHLAASVVHAPGRIYAELTLQQLHITKKITKKFKKFPKILEKF